MWYCGVYESVQAEPFVFIVGYIDSMSTIMYVYDIVIMYFLYVL